MSSTLLLWWCLCWSFVAFQASGYEYNTTWCWPKLWEGKAWTLEITQTDRGPDVLEKTSEISVDVVGQRIALHETGLQSGNAFDIFYLYYYPAGTVYKVENGVCTTARTDGEVPGCKVIPGDHITERMSKTVMGIFVPRNLIPVSAIGREYPEGHSEFYMTEMYGLYPVVDEVREEVNGELKYRVTYWFNATEGIRDPGIFTPPESCLKPSNGEII